MTLNEQINADLISAMKAKDTTTLNVLRVLKGEIQRAEQSSTGKVDLSDADIVKLIKKSIDGINETGGDQSEVAILEKYMPKQMSSNELDTQISIIMGLEGYNSPKDMGKIMAYFNQYFAGQYDGKLLSDMVKTRLTNSDSVA